MLHSVMTVCRHDAIAPPVRFETDSPAAAASGLPLEALNGRPAAKCGNGAKTARRGDSARPPLWTSAATALPSPHGAPLLRTGLPQCRRRLTASRQPAPK